MKKKIYIAGAGGMLGCAFHQEFSHNYELVCSDIDVNETWLHQIDFRDLEAYQNDVLKVKPNYLFHLGAYTDLEYCEKHQLATYATNTMAVENAVYIANRCKIPLLYISTAGIFDGSKDTFDDWDIPKPMCHYARSKFAGEIFVEQNVQQHLICRAGWMMGGGPKKDKKFVQKILKQIKDGKKILYVVNDKFGTPTYTHDFARNVQLLIEKEYWGKYNMVCQGVTSRYDVASEILKILNLDSEIKIVKVGSDHFQNEYFAQRPPSERLLNTKLELRAANIMRDWRVCLSEYLHECYSEYI